MCELLSVTCMQLDGESNLPVYGRIVVLLLSGTDWIYLRKSLKIRFFFIFFHVRHMEIKKKEKKRENSSSCFGTNRFDPGEAFV